MNIEQEPLEKIEKFFDSTTVPRSVYVVSIEVVQS